jgi:hypothetical protein
LHAQPILSFWCFRASGAARTIGHPAETNRLVGSSVRGADDNKIMTDRSTTARPDPQERATELFFLLTIGAAAVSLAAGLDAWRRSEQAPEPPGPPQPADDISRRTRKALQFFIIPLWSCAGIADWWCHRASRIEKTTGLKETALHLLMLGEAAVPVMAGLFLEINPLILGTMIAAFFIHEATAMWDVRYAVTGREVTPLEQHVHSFLEMVPLTAVSLISLLHWPQLKTLIGLRREKFEPLRKKAQPLGTAYALLTLAAMAVFGVLPYLEEAGRDLTQGRERGRG